MSLLLSFFVVARQTDGTVGDGFNTWTAVNIVLLFLLGVLLNVEQSLVTLATAETTDRNAAFEATTRRGALLLFYRVLLVLTMHTTGDAALLVSDLLWATIPMSVVCWVAVFVLTEIAIGLPGDAARLGQLAVLHIDAWAECCIILSTSPAATSAGKCVVTVNLSEEGPLPVSLRLRVRVISSWH